MSGVSVTVSRGVLSDTLTAIPGDTIVEAEDEESNRVKMKVRDYLIDRAEFEAIVGAGEKPKRGDSIVEVVADFTRTFEVIEVGGESSRWWDKAGQVLRVHTVEVDQAE